METNHRRSLGKVVLMGALAAGCLAIAPAEAKHRNAPKSSHQQHQHRSHPRAYRQHVFVPRVIRSQDRAYGRFYSGRSFYSPHRHHHVTYRFPVFVNGAMVHRAYSYCGERVFLSGSLILPHLALDVQLGRAERYELQGRHCDRRDDHARCDRHQDGDHYGYAEDRYREGDD